MQQWEETADQRSIFLRCYLMMTKNMLAAIDRSEFEDPAWVSQVLQRFADYYFTALEAYDRDPEMAPAVWQLAHKASHSPGALALQKLLLGVNAHINYDLVLTLVDLLKTEWGGLSEAERAGRYHDHCAINAVIGRTIDAVQDQILEQAMPGMDLVDTILGRLDERMISGLITNWRESVWQNTTRLLEVEEPAERIRLVSQVEAETLRRAGMIRLTDWRAALAGLL